MFALNRQMKFFMEQSGLATDLRSLTLLNILLDKGFFKQMESQSCEIKNKHSFSLKYEWPIAHCIIMLSYKPQAPSALSKLAFKIIISTGNELQRLKHEHTMHYVFLL